MKNQKRRIIFPVFFLILLEGSGLNSIEKSPHLSSPSPSSKISKRLRTQISRSLQSEEALKIWIFFEDKGLTSQTSMKNSLVITRQSLNEHCLWRRLKVRQAENLVDSADLPLFLPYLRKIESKVNRVRTASRWFNALSAEATPDQIESVSRLNFVQKIDLVLSFKRGEDSLSPGKDYSLGKDISANTSYGPSFRQLQQINIPPLHQLGYNGRGVLVCLLDVGFRKTHEIFRNSQIVAEWDFVNNDGDVQQDPNDPKDYSDSHGTATWSILGGYKPGDLIGPAYGAHFLLAKTETTNFEKPIEEDFWVAGVEWAEVLGAEVISSSLGYTDWYAFENMDGETAITTRAANRAVSLGVVVVNAVGNERNQAWRHIIAPADGFDVIAVGAVDFSGKIASFSSPGPTSDGRIKPEVCALGVDNWLASNKDNGSDSYQKGSGTSYATPLVAGVAACLLEIHRDWTPLQVRSALLNSSSQSQKPDNDYGWGIVNAALAADLDLALLKLQSYSIDDDSSGKSYGNGNGRAELGETLEITVTVKNEGRVSASKLEGSISSVHPDFEILRSKVTFPPIPPWLSRNSEEAFLVKIPASFLGHHALLLLKVEGLASSTLWESLRIPISR